MSTFVFGVICLWLFLKSEIDHKVFITSFVPDNTVKWNIGLCFCSSLSVQWDDSILCKNYQSCSVMGKKCAYCLKWQVVTVATMSGCNGECQRKHCSVYGLSDSCFVDCKQLKKYPNKTGFPLHTINHPLDVMW